MLQRGKKFVVVEQNMLQEIAQTISFLFLVVFLLACTYINTGFCVGIKKNCLQRLNDNTPCRAFN